MSEENEKKKLNTNNLRNILFYHRTQYYNMSDEEKRKIMNLANRIQLEKKIPIKHKTIQYIRTQSHECIICYQPYIKTERIGECLYCKQQLHQKCLLGWCITNINNMLQPTCPFCRADWKDNGKLNYP